MDRWLWKVCVGLSIAVVITIVIAGVKFKMHEDDPGGEACERVSALIAQQPAHATAWDARVAVAASSLEADGAPKITTSSRDARCHELFRTAYRTWRPKKYEAIERCVRTASSADAQARCFDQQI